MIAYQYRRRRPFQDPAARDELDAFIQTYNEFVATVAPGSAGPVTSFNTRVGAVTPLAADYDGFFLTPAEGNAAYQPLNAKLTSVAALASSAGWLHNDGAGTFVYSTPTATDVGLGNVTNAAQLPLSYLDVDGTLAANSDAKVASQKAVVTYVAAQIAATPSITALTGDGTATGPGSVALTLATVNADVGSFGSSTAIPVFTVNGKGLITAASTAVVVAPAGTLTGATLAAGVTISSLVQVGTITTGTWNGTAVANAYIASGLDVAKLTVGATLPSNVTASSLVSGGNSFAVGTSGARNNITLASAAAGSPVTITATGTSASIPITFVPKAGDVKCTVGGFHISGALQAVAASTLTFDEVTPATGAARVLAIGPNASTPGTFTFAVCSSDATEYSNVATFTGPAANSTSTFTFLVGATGVTPSLSVTTSDANIGMNLIPKGTGGVGINTAVPTAKLHLPAGTATAGTAPLKFTSGVSLTAAVAGSVEFTTDDLFFTITTGAARKAFVLDDGTRLTSGKVPVATTNGRLIDGLTIAAGVYTPTLTGVTNITGSTAYECQYMRVGNTVTVSGKADIDATTGAAFELGISLPVASDIGAEEDCAGTGVGVSATDAACWIKGDAANDRASMNASGVDGGASHSFFFTFSYQII